MPYLLKKNGEGWTRWDWLFFCCWQQALAQKQSKYMFPFSLPWNVSQGRIPTRNRVLPLCCTGCIWVNLSTTCWYLALSTPLAFEHKLHVSNVILWCLSDDSLALFQERKRNATLDLHIHTLAQVKFINYVFRL